MTQGAMISKIRFPISKINFFNEVVQSVEIHGDKKPNTIISHSISTYSLWKQVVLLESGVYFCVI